MININHRDFNSETMETLKMEKREKQPKTFSQKKRVWTCFMAMVFSVSIVSELKSL
jgi:hypothetical protein